MTYRVVEVFPTIQGEGYHAGTPAIFVRFAGCNLWSGNEDARERDAVRNSAACPRWCDTDFRYGKAMTLEQLVQAIDEVDNGQGLIVFTGGEPLLQVDHHLCDALGGSRVLAAETNGTVARTARGLWLTMSPKVRAEDLKLTDPDELKVVYPGYNPHEYEHLSPLRFVQPRAETLGVGRSLIVRDSTERAVAFVKENPQWRLSLQTHKTLGLP